MQNSEHMLAPAIVEGRLPRAESREWHALCQTKISKEHGMNAHEFAATLDYPCFFYAGIGSPGGTTIAILSETELPVDLSEINGTVKEHYGADIFTADEFDATDFGGSTTYKIQIINDEDLWKREFQEFHGIEPVTIDPTDHDSIITAIKSGVTTPKLIFTWLDDHGIYCEYDASADALILDPDRWHADDGNAEVEYNVGCSEEAAQEYVDGGDWGDHESTNWVTVQTWRIGIDSDGEKIRIDQEHHTITIHPDEPECSHSDGHDFQARFSIVGGIKENPGVHGHGGGVISCECCMHCGCKKTTDTWAQNPSNGEQGLISVEYVTDGYSEELEAYRDRKVKSFVQDHSDDDELDEDDMQEMFVLAFGRNPDDSDKRDGLWSHLCQFAGIDDPRTPPCYTIQIKDADGDWSENVGEYEEFDTVEEARLAIQSLHKLRDTDWHRDGRIIDTDGDETELVPYETEEE
jgi:hypothetical protein